MPTIKVKWNLQTYNTIVNSNTLVSEIIIESIKYFKLSGKNELYSLKIQGKDKPIDSSLSIRFTNLPQGATLELIYQGDKLEENGNKDKNIKIRSTFINSINGTIKNFVNNYESNDDINKLFEKADLNIESLINNGFNLKIQTITKTIDLNEINYNNLTLSNLGFFTGNHAIRILIGKSEINNKNKIKQESKVGKKDNRSYVQPNEEIDNKSEEESDDDEEEDQLTIAQARKYQEILTRRAAEEPMLTRALREKLARAEAESKEEKLKEIRNKTPDVEIKIILPNSKAIVVKIDKRQTLKELKQVLENRVFRKKVGSGEIFTSSGYSGYFYTLSTGHPNNTVILGNDMDPLIMNCKFGEEPLVSIVGNRITLYLTLNPAYRGVIDVVTESESSESITHTTKTNTNSNSKQEKNNNNNKDRINKTLNKLPKWARLGKK